MTVRERFLAKVEQTDSCWLWKASLGTSGYGQFGWEGRPVGAHRVSYLLFVGEIPDGMHVDHLCANKICVNPAHLEVVTADENVRRQTERRDACPNGHVYTAESTRWYRGYRRCVTCAGTNSRSRVRRPKPRASNMVGRVYVDGGRLVTVRIQWETRGCPRNVLVEHEDSRLVVVPSRRLRTPR